MTTPNQCRFWNCDEIIRRDHFLCYDHYTGHQEGRIDECPQCDGYKGASYPVCRNCERQPAAPQRGFARSSAGIAEPEARYYQPTAAPPGNANYAALLEELRDLRRNLARTHRLQDFMVFSNDTLEQLAQIRPANEREMLAISGVGPVKMERFGWDFLRVINAYVSVPPARESRRPASAAATVERDDREFAADKDADRFFVYILMQNDGEYYIGITSELRERLHEHRFNMSYSTAGKDPKLQWFTTVLTRAEAADLEVKLKQMNSHPASRREITRWVTDFQELTGLLKYDPYQSTPQPAERERLPYGGVAPPSSRRGRQQRSSSYQNDMDGDDLPF